MKLNLGCGSKIINGHVNVDKYNLYNVDLVHDLECFPYPFDDDVVDEILLAHVLEHLGQDPNIFNKIIKELYRICKKGATINIVVPHPRSDDFLADPTHVRPITAFGLSLYDKALNEQWREEGAANSPLALIHDVNFKIEMINYSLADKFSLLLKQGKVDQETIQYYSEHYYNVVKQIEIKWRVVKSEI